MQHRNRVNAHRRLIAIVALPVCLLSGFSNARAQAVPGPLLLNHVNLIDGTGSAPQADMRIWIVAGMIDKVEKAGGPLPADIRVVDLNGKTVMPAMIAAHVHIGVVRGNEANPEFYTRENILRQLKRYQDYGIGSVMCMGTDRPLIFPGFRDSSAAGALAGARMFSAGYGFSTPGGPPGGAVMNKLFRPATAEEVPAEMDSLAALHPSLVKMWVDDFGGSGKKMQPEIYKAIIREAHKHGIRVAAHLFYLEDAKELVEAGLDIIAHSIRDREVDDALIQKMKEKKILYIPTLSRDEYLFAYGGDPQWKKDKFFRSSLEPGVYEMIISKDYAKKIRQSPASKAGAAGYAMAVKNLKKLQDAGVLICMGTDSGAEPLRAQGFSEQLELELMVEAGLTPLQAITAATQNAAMVVGQPEQLGSVERGKKADLIILGADPSKNIKNTRKILSVYKDGVDVSHGPQ